MYTSEDKRTGLTVANTGLDTVETEPKKAAAKIAHE